MGLLREYLHNLGMSATNEHKKQKEELRAEFDSNPLKCGKVQMKPKETEKWLGQQISSGGLADSVAATVAAREPKIKGACLEIANIVNPYRGLQYNKAVEGRIQDNSLTTIKS